MTKFSIIIPVKEINDYVRENVRHILQMKNQDWELLILPNEQDLNEWNDSRIKIIASTKVGPATKRDIGAKLCLGEFLVFLDDDSYPNNDLLDIAIKYFDGINIVALGGPAITPKNNSFWQKVSGAVFLSKFSGGVSERYKSVGKVKEINDWPSVNFMIRKKVFLDVNGFNTKYWPGEDTILCLKIIENPKWKILYIPEMIVWHHRREGFLLHLKQIGAYGLHRGYFVKNFPKTSFKLIYFLPSLFVLFVLSSLGVNYYSDIFVNLYSFFWILYFIIIIKSLFDIYKEESLLIAICVLPYIVFTHFYYGLNFLKGIFSSELVSKLR